MLNSVEVNAFLRIPYLQADLSGARVHVFCGPNEAGKSSLGEAIRFAIRGLSSRVKKKGAFGELINSGKRSGSVEINLDGYPVRRNIKDGKVATKAPLDYPDLLVDIQLGAIEFAEAPTDDTRTEKGLRSMLNEMFAIGAQDEFIRARLRARGVTDDMMNRTMPLIRASGFAAAAEAAKAEHSRARGEWEGITKETYGSVKAQHWEPAILAEPTPDKQAIADAEAALADLRAKRDKANQQLGAISEAIRLHETAGDEPIEALEAAVDEAERAHRANEAKLAEVREESQETITEIQEQIRILDAKVQHARQATATLECPCCGAQLHVKTRENTPVLVQAETEAKGDGDITSLVEALSTAKKALVDARADQKEMVNELHATLTASQLALAQAQGALDRRRAAAARPAASPEDLERVANEIAALDQSIATSEAHVQEVYERARAQEHARREKARAAQAAQLAAQWSILTESFGSGPNGIPAELVAATTKPINAALTKLALPWNAVPCVMGADLSLSRADGTPYYLLSESAKWKANAMMQLALASVSTLKLVVLDGFDVIQPQDRAGFIDMLEDFTQRHPDITVLVMGTLKAKPVEQIDGFKFHWIQNGQLQEAA